MITNRLMLLYHSHFLTSTNTFFPKLLSSPNFFSLLRTTTSVTSSHTHSSSSSYGPSLQKGIIPYPTLKSLQNPFSNTAHNHPQQTQIPENDEESPFDEEQFTRVFAIAAIRVPSERCFEIEGRIRGHLLNWPRVSNIARVPGDEVDSEIQELLRAKKELGDEVEKEVSRRVYGKAEGDGEELSGVLYRDKLAKEFNSRGFVNFRNLAKISRPSKGKKRRKEGGGNDKSCGDVGEKAREKRKSVVVEVVEESEDDGDDLSGLLGDEFKGRKWRGSTRLLLLDETFAGRTFDELPEAVKAVLNEGSSEAVNSSYELVRCNMTLLYDYWSNDEVYNMDGRRFIEAIFSSEKTPSVTQVVMNLPNNAVEFLDAFRGIFRNQARDRKLTLPMIHIYGFSKAEDPEFDFHERIRVALEEAAFPVEMRRVRAVAPGKWMLCASFALPETVAFSKDYVDCR